MRAHLGVLSMLGQTAGRSGGLYFVRCDRLDALFPHRTLVPQAALSSYTAPANIEYFDQLTHTKLEQPVTMPFANKMLLLKMCSSTSRPPPAGP